jgi:tetratricopeptide (TPR) repeat protein
MYQYRIDTYYKNEIIFKSEEVFQPEQMSLELPRFVGNVTEKAFKNTTDLLIYCAQFAVSGTIRAWLLDNGEILQFELIEPHSDKAAVQSFIKGRSLIREEGKQEEAIEELSKAIEKHDRHAQAYERRAKTCFLLKNYNDALRDYNKCIGIDPTIASAYYGRARVYSILEKWKEAIENFDEAIKKSVALETVHWKSRRLKGAAHMQLGEYLKAHFELKLFINRKFKKNDPNLGWRRWALYNYGICCFETELYLDAVAAFDEVLNLPELHDGVDKSELLRLRGMSKSKAGKSGGIKDLKESVKLGNKKSSIFLKEMTK